jgi:RsiW-degrading membrane proteinase PrsW (M82 family)
VLLLKTPPIRGGDEFDAPEALTALLRAMALAFPTVGAFIVSRRPANAIGWILCFAGLLTGVRAFAAAYTYYGVAGRPDHLPGVEYAAWVGSWVGAPGVLLAAALLLLVFPDGRLIDKAWWAVVGMAACGTVLLALILALEQTQWIVMPEPTGELERIVQSQFANRGVERGG